MSPNLKDNLITAVVVLLLGTMITAAFVTFYSDYQDTKK